MPEAPTLSDDDNEGPLDGFRRDLAAAKGRTLVMERASDWKGNGQAGTSRSGMEKVVYGMDRSTVDPLRTATGRDVLAACGVPPTLFVANSDGTAQREAFRRFMHSSLSSKEPAKPLLLRYMRIPLSAVRNRRPMDAKARLLS